MRVPPLYASLMRDPHPTYLAPAQGTVDRRATVERHDPRLLALDPLAPLQVGNGEFAFAVDPTGLQTFPEAYPVEGGGSLLGTMAQWAWHSLPARRPYSLAETWREYETAKGPVPYVDLSSEAHDAAEQSEAESWLRGNPHKLQLASVSLWTGPGAEGANVPSLTELHDVDQRLELWRGTVTSRFSLAGARYLTTTAAHPRRDAVALTLVGPPGRPLGVRLRFPYGSDAWANASDWSKPDAHSTNLERAPGGWTIARRLDATAYRVRLWAEGLEPRRLAEHDLVLAGEGEVRLVIEFEPWPSGAAAGASGAAAPLDVADVLAASATGWETFWNSGAFVDFSGSDDPRAPELERRVVLSQYLTAVNCAGSLPPAETGLLLNSWRGKFHLEMHPFHALHFAAWGRPALLERSLAWYRRALPQAKETARLQRHAGARWPKQVGPEGSETPSSIGPFLVWQQPHLIYLLQMLYRAAGRSEALAPYEELLYETAEFMASFPTSAGAEFHLGPPLVPAQESYAATRRTALDPTFELAYWSWGLLAAAQLWRRLGRTPPDRWLEVSRAMAKPTVKAGTYAALATPPFLVRNDHPSMLAALGFVPATPLIDAATMERTYEDALGEWDWDSTWGWDYPVAAMTATRLGRSDAVDALLLDRPKNTYLSNGHNRQTARLPAYLPGNGGLLLAVALMVGGFDGAAAGQAASPGFDRGWSVAHEGFVRLP